MADSNYYQLYTNQNMTPVVFRSYTIPPQQSYTIDVPQVRVNRKGGVKIKGNFNFFTSENDVTIDILRAGKSIIGGPQYFFYTNFAFPNGTIFDKSIGTIDTHVRPGTYDYTIIITNNSTSINLDIDFYSVSIKSLNCGNKGEDSKYSENFYSKQSYPPHGKSAITLKSNKKTCIDLDVKKHGDQIKIEASLNSYFNGIIYIMPSPASAGRSRS